MKRLSLLALCLISPVAAETLADFQGKKRLLVVTEGSQQLATGLANSKAGLIERDVEVFVLTGPTGYGRRPDSELAKELRGRLHVRQDVAELILLGKDGHTVLRWTAGKFTFAVLFGSIDAMPMRKQEMRAR